MKRPSTDLVVLFDREGKQVFVPANYCLAAKELLAAAKYTIKEFDNNNQRYVTLGIARLRTAIQKSEGGK